MGIPFAFFLMVTGQVPHFLAAYGNKNRVVSGESAVVDLNQL